MLSLDLCEANHPVPQLMLESAVAVRELLAEAHT